MKTIFAALLLSLIALADPNCEIKPDKFAKFIKQDFDTFDQKPQGWRSLYNGSESCNLSTALLIDSYHLTHQAKMVPWQTQISYWHAGQYYAYLNLKDLAILRFSNSIDLKEKTKPDFHWNAYVRATIAFIKKDMHALQKAKDEFTVVAKEEINNFEIVKRFLRCFDASYFDAYTGSGKCK